MTPVLLTSALIAGLFGLSAPAPPAPPATPVPPTLHAFCRALWLFATPCTDISETIVRQIKAFSPQAGCEVCLYKLVSVSPHAIIANHTSADGQQVEDLSFVHNPLMSGGCSVSAKSRSRGFTSLLDDGLNYCNLYNILSASGLNLAPGFKEMTNEWACLGYSLATCKD